MENFAVEKIGVTFVQCNRFVVTKREIEADAQIGMSVDVENVGRRSDGDVDRWGTSHSDRKAVSNLEK